MKENLQKIILDIVSDSNIISKSDLISKVRDHLKTYSPEKESSRKIKPEYVIARTLKTMEEKDLLSYSLVNQTFSIGETGSQKLFKQSRFSSVIPMPHLGSRNGVWDGLWRVVILNFTEEDRTKRDIVRNVLKEASFKSIKQSIWVTPFVCEPLIQEIKRSLELKSEIILMTTRHFDPPIDTLI